MVCIMIGSIIFRVALKRYHYTVEQLMPSTSRFNAVVDGSYFGVVWNFSGFARAHWRKPPLDASHFVESIRQFRCI
jgi:hypothetical protein